MRHVCWAACLLYAWEGRLLLHYRYAVNMNVGRVAINLICCAVLASANLICWSLSFDDRPIWTWREVVLSVSVLCTRESLTYLGSCLQSSTGSNLNTQIRFVCKSAVLVTGSYCKHCWTLTWTHSERLKLAFHLNFVHVISCRQHLHELEFGTWHCVTTCWSLVSGRQANWVTEIIGHLGHNCVKD